MTLHVAKFKTVFTDNKIPKNSKNEKLIDWCKKFSENNLAPKYDKNKSHGNLSFRTNAGMIITCSGSDLANISEKELTEVTNCDTKKFVVYANGLRVPSSESFEHFEIYRERPDINAVFHGHSSQILGQIEKLGLIETKNKVDYGTIENLNEVMKILKENDFIIMKGHGFLCMGKNIEECGEKAVLLQKKAIELEGKN